LDNVCFGPPEAGIRQSNVMEYRLYCSRFVYLTDWSRGRPISAGLEHLSPPAIRHAAQGAKSAILMGGDDDEGVIAHLDTSLTSQAHVNVYSYVIDHDLGFAPNPFHGVCTLACCKPAIRKKAVVGDYVLGTGAVKPKRRGHLTFWMRVDEVITFDEYLQDRRFRRKKPRMSGTTWLRYGDNIYHRDGGETFQQEDSFQ
jgi:hypothetical protein